LYGQNNSAADFSEHEAQLDYVVEPVLRVLDNRAALQIVLVNAFITYRAFSPGFVAQCQIVQNTAPAINMAALGHLRRNWFVQANWTRYRVMSIDLDLFNFVPFDKQIRVGKVNAVVVCCVDNELAA
jgi:hypothetical protein